MAVNTVVKAPSQFMSRLRTGIIVVVVLILALGTSYTISSGTVGVLSTFGKYSEDVKLPGLHFKFPLAQRIRVFDVKLQTVTYKGHGEQRDEEGVFNRPSIQVLDNKSLPIGLELSVQFTPVAERANETLTKYGETYFDKLINPMIRDIVRDVVGKYQAEDLADKRSEIGREIQTRLAKVFENLPFVLNMVALRDVQLPPIVMKKVEEVQIAKQEEQRLAMIEKQARKDQEIKTIQANTRLIEVTTHAKADAEKKRIEADAKAYQIKAEADAVAGSNKLIAASITSDLIEYRSVDQWDGHYPQMLIGGGVPNQGLMLSMPQLAGQGQERR